MDAVHPGRIVRVFVQLSIGALLVALTIAMHVAVLDHIAHRVRAVADRHAVPLHMRLRLTLITAAALATFLSHVGQIWVWAVLYIAVGEFDHIEPALYFSTVVFTTVGFGDIVASAEWRLLAGCQAASGMLLFGLSTAFLFEMLREVLRRHRP
jgi:hypothetical protein